MLKVINWVVGPSGITFSLNFQRNQKYFADTLSRLLDHNITEPNPPEKDGYKYRYGVFKPLPDIDENSIDAMLSNPNTDTVYLKIEFEKLKTYNRQIPFVSPL